MLVISSPSGAGKSALSRKLLADDPELELSGFRWRRALRAPARSTACENYFFKDVPAFHAMRMQDLLEWAENRGKFSATPRKPVEEALAEGRDVLFGCRCSGNLATLRDHAAGCRLVFILPPSIAELERRLKGRASDGVVIRRRLTTAQTEFRHWQSFDYVLVNEDFDTCFVQIHSILDAETHKRSRNLALEARISVLQTDLSALLARPA